MSSSTIESPTITVLTSTNGPVANQSVTSASSIKIKVDDKSSGPGRLEVRRAGESQPFATFGKFEALQTTSYIFTPLEEGAALGGLGTLAAGQYVISAWDQAGNSAGDFGFIRREPYFLGGSGREAVCRKGLSQESNVFFAGGTRVAQWIGPLSNIRGAGTDGGATIVAQSIEQSSNIQGAGPTADTRFFRTVLPCINDFRKVVTPSRDLIAAGDRFGKFNPIYCRLRCRDVARGAPLGVPQGVDRRTNSGVLEGTYRVTNSCRRPTRPCKPSSREITPKVLTFLRRETGSLSLAVRRGVLFDKAARGVGRGGNGTLYV